jgi:hypothetical protein
MNPVFATFHDGQVELESAVDWPEGARLAIYPASERIGLDEGSWEDTPEARASLIAKMDGFAPLDLTEEDGRLINAAREESKKVSIEAVRRQMGL